MNRRSFLTFLGLAPVAAPAAVAAARPPIDYSDLAATAKLRIGDTVSVIDLRSNGSTEVTFDAGRFTLRANADGVVAARMEALVAPADAGVASFQAA